MGVKDPEPRASKSPESYIILNINQRETVEPLGLSQFCTHKCCGGTYKLVIFGELSLALISREYVCLVWRPPHVLYTFIHTVHIYMCTFLSIIAHTCTLFIHPHLLPISPLSPLPLSLPLSRSLPLCPVTSLPPSLCSIYHCSLPPTHARSVG